MSDANSLRRDTWAVHAGDVAPVPEPETYALMIIGLGALGVVARRKKRRAAA